MFVEPRLSGSMFVEPRLSGPNVCGDKHASESNTQVRQTRKGGRVKYPLIIESGFPEPF